MWTPSPKDSVVHIVANKRAEGTSGHPKAEFDFGYDVDGALLKFINIYVNDEDVRFIGGLDLALNAGDNVTILPAVAGGAKNCGAI